MAVLDVKPRRTVGISGSDVGMVSRGMASCSPAGLDEYGELCTDFSPITNDPANTATALNYLYNTPPAQPVFGTPAPSGGVDWGKLFAPLANAAGAIGSGYAASQLKPGQSLSTPGTIITGAGTTLPGSGLLGASSSSMLPILLLGGGALLLVMMMGKR